MLKIEVNFHRARGTHPLIAYLYLNHEKVWSVLLAVLVDWLVGQLGHLPHRYMFVLGPFSSQCSYCWSLFQLCCWWRRFAAWLWWLAPADWLLSRSHCPPTLPPSRCSVPLRSPLLPSSPSLAESPCFWLGPKRFWLHSLSAWLRLRDAVARGLLPLDLLLYCCAA